MTNSIQHPKVVVIGAGSLFFGRQAIWQMVHSIADADAILRELIAAEAEMLPACWSASGK